MVTSVTNLDLLSFIRDAQARGYLQSSWYLYAVQAGNELRSGGLSPVRRPHGTVSCGMLSRITLVMGGISTLAVAFALTTSCGDSGDCNPPKWTDQCVEASVLWLEFPEKFRAAVGIVLEDADAGASGSAPLRCPTLRELNYELVRPYSVELQGEAFTSEPESGRADSLCCYTTTFYCY